MSIGFFLGKTLRIWGSYPSLVRWGLPIISTSVGGMSHFFYQVTSMDVILTEYCMEGQARTMRVSVIYKNIFSMGYMTLSRIFMISCEMF